MCGVGQNLVTAQVVLPKANFNVFFVVVAFFFFWSGAKKVEEKG